MEDPAVSQDVGLPFGRDKRAAVRKQLTAARVDKIAPPPIGQRLEIFDSIVPNLALRVTDRGSKSFILRGRVRGNRQPLRIWVGDPRAMRLAEARQVASDLLRELRLGRDPREQKRAAKEAAEQAAKTTVAAVADQYIKEHIGKLKASALAESLIRRTIVKAWGRRPVSSITTKEVAELVRSIAEVEPHKASKTLNHCRSLFQWCMAPSRGYVDKNPVAGMTAKRDFGITSVPRQVALANDQLRTIWRAAGALNFPGGAFVRFLLLSGQRRSEVAGMRWGELDLEDAKVWNIPAPRMKAGRPHEVPLSPAMLLLLREIPFQGPFVFSAGGSRKLTGFSVIKEKLDAKIGTDMPAWTFHDLRRAVRTGLSALPGIPFEVRELVIAHVPDTLTRTYDQHSFRDEKRAALSLWDKRLAELVS